MPTLAVARYNFVSWETWNLSFTFKHVIFTFSKRLFWGTKAFKWKIQT